jgi:hypothetical protein
MKKIVFLFFIFINISFALEVVNFEDRQKVLQDVKSIILYEESIARAYEEYILTNYAIPTLAQIKILIGDLPITDTGVAVTLSLDSTLTKISYGLSDDLEDSSIKALYESNTFRKRTYYRNNEINFVLEDIFAKHLYDLIKQKGSGLGVCASIANADCIKNNHVYIKPTYTSGEITSFLINYHIDKFKAGPIIVTSDTSKHITEEEFDSIPKGALIYDITGIKYLKTTSGIEVLK